MSRVLQTIVAALAVVPIAQGHTWIEQLRNVNDKGQYVGEYGYPRGMVAKTDPGYNGFSMNWLMPDGDVFIRNDTILCHKDQRQQKQSSDKYPRLQAVPGGFIAMRYMENGHVTKPQNQIGKPAHAGTVFVYGTTQPKEDEKLVDVLYWTEDGKGGDGRGTLIATNNYDDGRCYETNETPEYKQRAKEVPNYAMGQGDDGPGTMPLFCETNVQLPKTADVGKPYTLYWVWQWNTAPGIDPGLPKGKDEYYSTCIDVDVASADVALAADAEPKFALGQQDAMAKAVSDFASRTAAMTDALKGEVGPIFGGGNQTSAPSAPVAGAPSQPPAPAPAPSRAPAPSSPAPPLSGQPPRASGPAGIPTLTRRPGAAPSNPPGGDNVVTVTDTVFITMTASETGAPPSTMVTSKRAVSSAKSQAPPAAGITTSAAKSSPAGVAPPGSAAPTKLPGFDMSNPRGAKFRNMF
ncbi:hypothetical protein HBI82_151820 [Parastagonospora nodorum]|nr:hypothetical protein HBH46_079830 [Parastagonospora nodorum]KAH4122425.1 hypothetical protein HBH47_091040 [Parastagonospora nodorum]KAH4190650.1 hypothetical protein HBH42_131820 [Parastagonospora nodorum]KAH4936470.1 hypothetical protein HBI79_066960 [Parastagonospora nodorum]KAH5106897.1 hypothetical protein HBH72_049920 [Parastagonospora nodorum]